MKLDDFPDDLDDRFFWRFGRTKPIRVKGGIRAQRKKFGNQWWGVRWLEAIEKFGPAKRVARGRSYARKGQVLELRMEPGQISAIVQGSRDQPYQVEISLERVPADVESSILQELGTQPIFAATFLAGEVPPDIEKVFRHHRVPLFPTKAEGRSAFCSCPDDKNPCKHIAAIYYLISEELERDPFLLLHLRGIRREKLAPAQKELRLFAYQQEEPLPSDPQQFWKAPRVKEIAIVPPETSKAKTAGILQRLGSFPFWRGEQDFTKTMEMIYEKAKEYAKR
jgi:uncharacterized Zn finger protein